MNLKNIEFPKVIGLLCDSKLDGRAILSKNIIMQCGKLGHRRSDLDKSYNL
jgi:hypothetical protein